MSYVRIENACSQNWNEMTPTERGAFCGHCSLEVIDFTGKSSAEIKQTLVEYNGSRMCGRISSLQLDALNREFEAIFQDRKTTMRFAMFVSLVMVFGFGLFSCNSPEAEQLVQQMQRQHLVNTETHVRPEEVIEEPVEEIPLREVEYVPEELIWGEEEVLREYKEIEAHAVVDREMIMLGDISTQVIVRDYLVQEIYTAEERDSLGRLLPVEFSDKAFPNPTRDQVTYEIAVAQKDLFVLGVYSLDGRHIRNLYEGELERGYHQFGVNLVDEPPGMYLIVTRSRSYSNSEKVVRL